ncbi:Fur-regulated basic protein FbpA [Robertmurraya massiliosenegalensis]|uniref:Fur-regulated basic protein FbpA n=1 Tax=Robertmurraya TaxID=2837507 RepID=UPI0039A70D0F
MPVLRNAVQKRREHVISVLMNTGVFKQEEIQSLTLTELEVEYKKLSNKKKGVIKNGQ